MRVPAPREICEHGSQKVKCPICELDAAENRISEIEDALRRAQRRFELLAAVSDEMTNGVKPSVGAAECAAALATTKK